MGDLFVVVAVIIREGKQDRPDVQVFGPYTEEKANRFVSEHEKIIREYPFIMEGTYMYARKVNQ